MTDAMDLFKANATPDAPEESAIEIFKKQQQAAPYLEMRVSRETPASPLDIFKGNEQAARDRALNLTRMTAADIDPGRQARALQVAKDRKIPVDAAYAFIDELTHKPAPGYGEMAQAAPFTANLAADPFKGPVVFGDEKPLMEIEKGLTSFLKQRAPTERRDPQDVVPSDMTALQLVNPMMASTISILNRVAAKDGPLLDRLLGPDVTHLTAEQASAEHQQRIGGAIAGIDAAMAAVDRARADIYWQMTTGGASEIDAPRPAGSVDPATMPGIDASPGVANLLSGLDDARKSFDRAMAVRPSLKQWAELANVAADTITSQSLNAVAGVSRWTDVVRSLGPGFMDQVNRYLPNAGNELDLAYRFYSMIPQAPLDAAGQSDTSKSLDAAVQELHRLFPSDPARQDDMLPKAVGAIASVIPFVLGGWVGKLAGANPAMVAGMLGSFSMAGDTAADAQAHGATPTERNIATVIATAMGWTEALPVDNIFDMAAKNAGRGFRNFVSETFFDIMKQMGIEGVQEVGQSLPIDLFARQTYDRVRDVWGNAGQNFLYGAIAGGPFAALASLARALPEVDRNTKALQQIAAASQASNTVKIAPDVVREHVADMVKDGKVPAFVSAAVEHVETLFQEVWADVAKPAYEVLRKAVDEAKRTGAEVSIHAELIPFIAQLKGFSALTDNIRMPDSLTPNEVRQLHDELKTFVEDQAKAPPQTVEASPVLAQMREQLVAAGQAPEVAATQATLFAATLETMARRAGQDPMELMRRYNPTVQSTVTAPAPGDVVLEQRVRRPMNILEFIASKGGLRDDNGELAARGLTTANARTRYGNAYRKPGDFTGNTGLFGGEGRRTGDPTRS